MSALRKRWQTKKGRQELFPLFLVSVMSVVAVALAVVIGVFNAELRPQAQQAAIVREIPLTQFHTGGQGDTVWHKGVDRRLRSYFPSTKGSGRISYIGQFDSVVGASYAGLRFGGLQPTLRDFSVIKAEIEIHANRRQVNPVPIEIFAEDSVAPNSFTTVDLPMHRTLMQNGMISTTIDQEWPANAPSYIDVTSAFNSGIRNTSSQDAIAFIIRGVGNRKMQRSFHTEYAKNPDFAPKLKLTVRPRSGGATQERFIPLGTSAGIVSAVMNEEGRTRGVPRVLQTGPKGAKAMNYLGSRAIPDKTYTGFHFTGDFSIPSGQRLASAELELTSSKKGQNERKPFDVVAFAELNTQPQLFGIDKYLYTRTLSTASVVGNMESFQPTGDWNLGTKHRLDVTAPVNEYLRLSGNKQSLALILQGAGVRNKTRFFYNGDGKPENAPKLILTFVGQNVPATPTSTPTPTLAPPTPTPVVGGGEKTLRVVEVKYFPFANERDQLRTRSIQQSSALRGLFSEMSRPKAYNNPSVRPYLNVDIVRTIERNGQSPNTNPSSNDPLDFDRNYRSLNEILTANNNEICNLIRSQGVDQVWYYVDVIGADQYYDNGGFRLENYVNLSNTLNRNQPQTHPSLCGGANSFVVVSIDINREITAHGWIHAIEDYFPNFLTEDLFWRRFVGKSGYPEYNSLANNCGDSHFPPNGSMGSGLGYDYTNSRTVSSRCENWQPDGGGTTTQISCSRWGCTEAGYNKWWGQNWPNKNNGLTYQGKNMPNWWDFVVDIDEHVTNYAQNSEEWFINMDWLRANADDSVTRSGNIDNVTTAQRNGQGSISWQHTSTGNDRLLLVAVGYATQEQGGAVNSVSMNAGGQTLQFTKAREDKFSNAKSTEIWYLVNQPNSGSITVNLSGNHDVAASAISFVGVDTSNPVQIPGNGVGTANVGGSSGNFSRSISVPSRSGDIALVAASSYTDGNTFTPTNGTQELLNFVPHNTNLFIGTRQSTGSNTTLNWTTTNNWFWAASSISIRLR